MQLEVRRHRENNPWTYSFLDRRQREIAAQVREGEQGRILLSEVAPVITLGRRTQPTDLLFSPDEIRRRGVEVFPTDRGGLATYHGPGQWVLFVVDYLERLTGSSKGVRKAIEGLLQVACGVARIYEPRAEIRWGSETGVWTPRGKVAAVGIHIEKGVLLHGLAINGFQTPTSFLGLGKPCGLDAPINYLLRAQDSQWLEGAFDQLGERLVEHLRSTFNIFAISSTPECGATEARLGS